MLERSLSAYEREALRAIQEWRAPSERTLLAKVGGVINKPFEAGAELVMKIPGAETAVQKSVGGLVSLLNDAAQWSVRPDAIYQSYRDNGLAVSRKEDIMLLDLQDVDRTIGWLSAKYKGLAAVEGVGTGLVGLVGIPADVVALISMNLRAIGEYATFCGFDLSLQQERLFALDILGMASSSTDVSKQLFMANLVKVSKDVAKKKAWKHLEKHAFVSAVQKLAKALGIRLTKAKLAQVVPAAGAIVGGGFNAYYTAKVCDAAFHLYRERMLAEKYGVHVVESV